MNRFEEELKMGNFVTSECNHCDKIVWPPSDYCDSCFGDVNWRKVLPDGKIIEWSKTGNEVFCIEEFEKTIQIMGKIDGNVNALKYGQMIKLTKCLLEDKHKFFFSLINK